MAGVVVFDSVWKKFQQGERHNSLRDLVPATFRALSGGRPADLEAREFWALENVSFEVQPGEALGIVGPNGAGKSTTLKLLTRILRPNRGRCAVLGRVGALIEVAAGFHPDLTGRENVYLQGAIMGMKRREIDERFDAIIDFAGVHEFVDTPVKRYSSGMNARLGFSIAAHLSPDVLIIDEVLSVGDMAFQERCLERMRAFKREGVTIVFVSHNLQAVNELCDKAVFLNRRVIADGPAADVIATYVRGAHVPSSRPSASEIRINHAELQRCDGTAVAGPVSPGQRARLVVDFEVIEPMSDLGFALILHRSTDDLLVYDGHFSQSELGLESPVPAGRFRVHYDVDLNLTRGQYYFDVYVSYNPTQRFVARLRPAAHLTVAETRTWGGVAHLNVATSLAREADSLAGVGAG